MRDILSISVALLSWYKEEEEKWTEVLSLESDAGANLLLLSEQRLLLTLHNTYVPEPVMFVIPASYTIHQHLKIF